MSYFFVALTIAFTVYGQLILKWQVTKAGALPAGGSEIPAYLIKLLLNPWVLSGFAAAFMASLAWMAAVSKLELSRAYPFMSMNFVLVLILSSAFFGEAITVYKAAGLVLILLGLIVGNQT